MNSRLDSLQAAILLPNLELLDEEIQLRNQAPENYTQLLTEAGINTTPLVEEHIASAWAQYTIRIVNREAVQAKLKDADIPTAVHNLIPLNKQPAVVDMKASLPRGNEAAEGVMNLLMHAYMSEADQRTVVEALRVRSCL